MYCTSDKAEMKAINSKGAQRTAEEPLPRFLGCGITDPLAKSRQLIRHVECQSV